MTRSLRTEPDAAYPPGWFVGQLPVGMRDDDLLVRFTTIFERVGATLRAGADGVDRVVDTTVTTPGMLRYLGNWIGYDLLDPGLRLTHQRDLIDALGYALPRRGTRLGLTRLLEALTAGPVHITEPGAVIREGASHTTDGTVVVYVTGTGHLRLHELRALIRDEVPAHLAIRVEVGPPPAELTGATPSPSDASEVLGNDRPTSDTPGSTPPAPGTDDGPAEETP